MDTKLARKSLMLVNNVEAYNLLQDLIAGRIEELRNHLESTKVVTRINEIQGAIAELRRLQHLREEITQEAKNERE